MRIFMVTHEGLIVDAGNASSFHSSYMGHLNQPLLVDLPQPSASVSLLNATANGPTTTLRIAPASPVVVLLDAAQAHRHMVETEAREMYWRDFTTSAGWTTAVMWSIFAVAALALYPSSDYTLPIKILVSFWENFDCLWQIHCSVECCNDPCHALHLPAECLKGRLTDQTCGIIHTPLQKHIQQPISGCQIYMSAYLLNKQMLCTARWIVLGHLSQAVNAAKVRQMHPCHAAQPDTHLPLLVCSSHMLLSALHDACLWIRGCICPYNCTGSS